MPAIKVDSDTTIEISHQLLADIIMISRKDIDHWCDVVSYATGENPALDHMYILVDEDAKDYKITVDTVQAGIQAIMDGKYQLWHSFEMPNGWADFGATVFHQTWDAIHTDTTMLLDGQSCGFIIQVGLFGEPRYE